jgi:prophage regulatory protein
LVVALDVVGIQEIADMLGVSKQRVSQIIQTRPDFPAPDAEITIGRIWLRSAIDRWMRTYNPRPGRPRSTSRQ